MLNLFCGNVYWLDGLFGDANRCVTVLMASKKICKIIGGLLGLMTSIYTRGNPEICGN